MSTDLTNSSIVRLADSPLLVYLNGSLKTEEIDYEVKPDSGTLFFHVDLFPGDVVVILDKLKHGLTYNVHRFRVKKCAHTQKIQFPYL